MKNLITGVLLVIVISILSSMVFAEFSITPDTKLLRQDFPNAEFSNIGLAVGTYETQDGNALVFSIAKFYFEDEFFDLGEIEKAELAIKVLEGSSINPLTTNVYRITEEWERATFDNIPAYGSPIGTVVLEEPATYFIDITDLVIDWSSNNNGILLKESIENINRLSLKNIEVSLKLTFKDCNKCPDVNDDNVVDIFDLVRVSTSIFSGNLRYDLNGDDKVRLGDIFCVGRSFGNLRSVEPNCGAISTSSPTPSTTTSTVIPEPESELEKAFRESLARWQIEDEDTTIHYDAQTTTDEIFRELDYDPTLFRTVPATSVTTGTPNDFDTVKINTKRFNMWKADENGHMKYKIEFYKEYYDYSGINFPTGFDMTRIPHSNSHALVHSYAREFSGGVPILIVERKWREDSVARTFIINFQRLTDPTGNEVDIFTTRFNSYIENQQFWSLTTQDATNQITLKFSDEYRENFVFEKSNVPPTTTTTIPPTPEEISQLNKNIPANGLIEKFEDDGTYTTFFRDDVIILGGNIVQMKSGEDNDGNTIRWFEQVDIGDNEALRDKDNINTGIVQVHTSFWKFDNQNGLLIDSGLIIDDELVDDRPDDPLNQAPSFEDITGNAIEVPGGSPSGGTVKIDYSDGQPDIDGHKKRLEKLIGREIDLIQLYINYKRISKAFIGVFAGMNRGLTGFYDDKLEEYREAFKDDPEKFQGFALLLAEKAIQNGDLEGAIVYLTASIEADPNSLAALNAKAGLSILETNMALELASMNSMLQFLQDMNREDIPRSFLSGWEYLDSLDPYTQEGQNALQAIWQYTKSTTTRAVSHLNALGPIAMIRDASREYTIERIQNELRYSQEAATITGQLVYSGQATDLGEATDLIRASAAGEPEFRIGQTLQIESYDYDGTPSDILPPEQGEITDRYIEDGEWVYEISANGRYVGTIKHNDFDTLIAPDLDDANQVVISQSGTRLEDDTGIPPDSVLNNDFYQNYDETLARANELEDQGILGIINPEHSAYLDNEPAIQLAIANADVALPGTENQQGFYDMAQEYRDRGNLQGAALTVDQLAIYAQDPELRADSRNLYDDITGEGLFAVSDEFTQGSTVLDFANALANPAVMGGYGLLGNGMRWAATSTTAGTRVLSVTGRVLTLPRDVVAGTPFLRALTPAVAFAAEEGGEELVGAAGEFIGGPPLGVAAEGFAIAATGGPDAADILQAGIKNQGFGDVVIRPQQDALVVQVQQPRTDLNPNNGEPMTPEVGPVTRIMPRYTYELGANGERIDPDALRAGGLDVAIEGDTFMVSDPSTGLGAIYSPESDLQYRPRETSTTGDVNSDIEALTTLHSSNPTLFAEPGGIHLDPLDLEGSPIGMDVRVDSNSRTLQDILDSNIPVPSSLQTDIHSAVGDLHGDGIAFGEISATDISVTPNTAGGFDFRFTRPANVQLDSPSLDSAIHNDIGSINDIFSDAQVAEPGDIEFEQYFPDPQPTSTFGGDFVPTENLETAVQELEADLADQFPVQTPPIPIDVVRPGDTTADSGAATDQDIINELDNLRHLFGDLPDQAPQLINRLNGIRNNLQSSHPDLYDDTLNLFRFLEAGVRFSYENGNYDYQVREKFDSLQTHITQSLTGSDGNAYVAQINVDGDIVTTVDYTDYYGNERVKWVMEGDNLDLSKPNIFLSAATENTAIDYNNDPWLQNFYENDLQDVKSLAQSMRENGALEEDIEAEVINQIATRVHNAVGPNEEFNVRIQEFLRNYNVVAGETCSISGGVCRHKGPIIASTLQRFSNDGILRGRAVINGGYGHVWAEYIVDTPEGTNRYIIDIVENFIGPLDELEAQGRGNYFEFTELDGTQISYGFNDFDPFSPDFNFNEFFYYKKTGKTDFPDWVNGDLTSAPSTTTQTLTGQEIEIPQSEIDTANNLAFRIHKEELPHSVFDSFGFPLLRFDNDLHSNNPAIRSLRDTFIVGKPDGEDLALTPSRLHLAFQNAQLKLSNTVHYHEGTFSDVYLHRGPIDVSKLEMVGDVSVSGSMIRFDNKVTGESVFIMEDSNINYKSHTLNLPYYSSHYNVETELRWAQNFHELDPDHFPRPISFTYDNSGRIVGYIYQNTPGFTLSEFLTNVDQVPPNLQANIANVFQNLDDNGYRHGNIRGDHIIITPHHDGTVTFTIINPAGYIDPLLGSIEQDLEALDEIFDTSNTGTESISDMATRLENHHSMDKFGSTFVDSSDLFDSPSPNTRTVTTATGELTAIPEEVIENSDAPVLNGLEGKLLNYDITSGQNPHTDTMLDLQQSIPELRDKIFRVGNIIGYDGGELIQSYTYQGFLDVRRLEDFGTYEKHGSVIKFTSRFGGDTVFFVPEYNKFLKRESDRMQVTRNGRHRTIEDEVTALQAMHEIYPEHVVKVHRVITEEVEGVETVTAYEMEFIVGMTLYDFLDVTGFDLQSLQFRIEGVMINIHEAGYAHGDLHTYNIMVIPKPDGTADFKIIDPIGYDQGEIDILDTDGEPVNVAQQDMDRIWAHFNGDTTQNFADSDYDITLRIVHPATHDGVFTAAELGEHLGEDFDIIEDLEDFSDVFVNSDELSTTSQFSITSATGVELSITESDILEATNPSLRVTRGELEPELHDNFILSESAGFVGGAGSHLERFLIDGFNGMDLLNVANTINLGFGNTRLSLSELLLHNDQGFTDVYNYQGLINLPALSRVYTITSEGSTHTLENPNTGKKIILDQDDFTFYKSDSRSVHEDRFGREFTAEDEFNALSAMHERFPQYYARTFDLIRDAEGVVVGYTMERVRGLSLYEFQGIANTLPANIQTEAYAMIEGIHDNTDGHGRAHGDPHDGNFMVVPFQDETVITLGIDPAGLGEGELLQEGIVIDLELLEEAFTIAHADGTMSISEVYDLIHSDLGFESDNGDYVNSGELNNAVNAE